MTGLKAQIKKYLRSNGINMITNDQGRPFVWVMLRHKIYSR